MCLHIPSNLMMWSGDDFCITRSRMLTSQYVLVMERDNAVTHFLYTDEVES